MNAEPTQPQLPPPDANGWRPIDCAPKDECVLLTGEPSGVYMGFWQEGRGWMTGHVSGHLIVYVTLNPQHWMPMPGMPL